MLIGISILVIGVVIFGAGQIFKKVFIIETYFDGSVQGIDIGSPIKFRGIKIGEVKEITMVGHVYPQIREDESKLHTYGLYVLVRGEVDADKFRRFLERDVEARKEKVNKLINESGMRMTMVPLGITGLSYLELDFLDPKTNPPLNIVWEPDYCYIPSVPGTIQQLSESLTQIANALNKQVFPMLENLNETSESFPEIAQELKQSLKSLNDTLESTRVASEDFPRITSNLDAVLYQVRDILDNEKYSIEQILDNLRVITNDLKDITFELKHNPSRVIFGDPPPEQGVKK